MFVSEQMRAYPCSFMTELCEGHEIADSNLQEIWQKGELFVEMRESLSPTRCRNCRASPYCMSGCPLFPEINICDSVIEETAVRKAMREGAFGYHRSSSAAGSGSGN